jgi:hypothetical protein
VGSREAGDRNRLTRIPPQGAIVAVLALAGLCASFMYTLVVPIQAKLPELLNASREDTAWVVTATLLTAAVVTPIAGRLGDMYGKRRIVIALPDRRVRHRGALQQYRRRHRRARTPRGRHGRRPARHLDPARCRPP